MDGDCLKGAWIWGDQRQQPIELGVAQEKKSGGGDLLKAENRSLNIWGINVLTSRVCGSLMFP